MLTRVTVELKEVAFPAASNAWIELNGIWVRAFPGPMHLGLAANAY
jgi:hypothetical protein